MPPSNGGPPRHARASDPNGDTEATPCPASTRSHVPAGQKGCKAWRWTPSQAKGSAELGCLCSNRATHSSTNVQHELSVAWPHDPYPASQLDNCRREGSASCKDQNSANSPTRTESLPFRYSDASPKSLRVTFAHHEKCRPTSPPRWCAPGATSSAPPANAARAASTQCCLKALSLADAHIRPLRAQLHLGARRPR